MKKVVLTFGRMNPPTVGHEKLVNKVVEVAKANQATPLVYLSHTQNAKKDPLSYADKTKYAKKAFGRIVVSSSARHIIEVMKELEEKGFTDVTLVVGSDRIQEFKTLLNKYNGKEFTFNSIKVQSAGERDPDAEGVEGMSASKLRELARSGNQREFMKGVPPKLSPTDGARLYKTLRKGMMVENTESFIDTFNEFITISSYSKKELDRSLIKFKKIKDRYRKLINTPLSNEFDVYYLGDTRGGFHEYIFTEKDTGEPIGSFEIEMPFGNTTRPKVVKPGVRIVTPHLSFIPKYQGQGLAKRTYLAFLKMKNYVFITDRHTKEAAILWNSLAKERDIVTFYYDKDTGKISKTEMDTGQDEVKFLGLKSDFNLPRDMGEETTCSDTLKRIIVEEIDLEAFVETLDIDSLELDEDEDIEEVLTLTQRLKKSRIMKRLAPRFKRLRQVKAKRLAPPERLQQRARKQALSLIRKRAAGEMGAHYGELSPAAKISVDRLIQKKLPLIGKLAQRLLPKVRKAELERLKRARASTPQAEATEVPQDKDIKDKKGTQPAKYFKDLAPSTKAARDTHFKKGKEKASDDPSAYKPAPGDSSAETKPSVHTKKFKQMYGEQNFNGQNYDGGGDDLIQNKMRTSMISAQKKAKNVNLNGEFEKLFQNEQNTFLQRTRDRHQSARQALQQKHSMEKERLKRSHEGEIDRAQIRDIRSESLDEKFAHHSTSSITPRNNYTLESKGAEGLKKKADKTGIPYGILKKVYDRGVAAWRTGHRPGTTPQQWGFARVNSFATGGKTRTTADADLWKQVKKESVRVGPYFGKAGITEEIISLNWKNEDPAKYAIHLSTFFGQPDSITDGEIVWEAKDGFKRIVVKDEYILHGSPAPHYDFIYCYIDLFVPNKFATALAESSGSILIDFLKGEVGARCGSITANATTLNYVLDVVAGRVAPSKQEYEKRILNMSSMFDRGQKFEVEWWPDVTGDADPNNPYYKDSTNEHFKPCGCEVKEGNGLWANIYKKRREGRPMREPGSKGAPTKQDFKNALEDFKLTRLGSNPGKFKRLVTKHLGAKAAEKIGASDGQRIMSKAKQTGNQKLFRQGSFIKNFYRKTNEEKSLDEARTRQQIEKEIDAIRQKIIDISNSSPGNHPQAIENRKRMARPLTQQKQKLEKELDALKEESLDEAFTLAMVTPAGMGSVLTAADIGIKMQGGYTNHPSVNEVGGAGEYGSSKLTRKYKQDTPGQNEAVCELSDDNEFYGFTEEEFEVTGNEQYEEGWEEDIIEAEYQGRKVSLGKPFLTPDGPKKRSVYVTNDKGNVVKVNFGDPNMTIKKSDPDRRRSFRARHNCDNPGPRWMARYWSCKAW